MWYLKFKYKHSDCIYAPKLKKHNLNVFFFHLGAYVKNGYVYTSALQQVVGKDKDIRKYCLYLKRHAQINKAASYGNIILTLARHSKDLAVYEAVYNTLFLHPAPAYLSSDGFEIIELACWERKPLEELIRAMRRNKTTTYFKMLKFVNRKMNDLYVTRLLPKLSKKQEEAIRLAYKEGYYAFPRKINLDALARIAKVTKPTLRENLRKAEAKLIPNLISQ